MDTSNYYNDKKWCPACEAYVPYLMSIEHSYCTGCGSEVRLFSDEDWSEFQEGMTARRPKGGRPSKKAQDNDDDRRTA